MPVHAWFWDSVISLSVAGNCQLEGSGPEMLFANSESTVSAGGSAHPPAGMDGATKPRLPRVLQQEQAVPSSSDQSCVVLLPLKSPGSAIVGPGGIGSGLVWKHAVLAHAGVRQSWRLTCSALGPRGRRCRSRSTGLCRAASRPAPGRHL